MPGNRLPEARRSSIDVFVIDLSRPAGPVWSGGGSAQHLHFELRNLPGSAMRSCSCTFSRSYGSRFRLALPRHHKRRASHERSCRIRNAFMTMSAPFVPSPSLGKHLPAPLGPVLEAAQRRRHWPANGRYRQWSAGSGCTAAADPSIATPTAAVRVRMSQ